MTNTLNMQKAMDKAEILIEALPYIQKFNRKIMVIKYGGSAMESRELQQKVMQDVVLLKLVGFKPIIVHGGGKEISKWSRKVGLKPKFVDGFRVTDKETLEVAEMALSKVNQDLLSMICKLGVKPIGMCGKDGNMLLASRKKPGGKDIGFVGDVKQVNTRVISDMLKNDLLPVIFPIGIDEKGQSYNINADDAATAIAEAMDAEKLAFLSDIEGVYEDKDDPDTLMAELYAEDAKKLIADGLIDGGMLPKLKNCIEAIDAGVSRVHIIDGRIPHCLLLEFFTNRGVGTAILNSKESKYYND
ncbi:acetylglutamate kinase [Aminicella lysinilytica]|uniref:Acetylglutamate kinase n=1 Tax=Aminicella lysinilytica TaxID=433323 RepID=A0A4R6Q645_9FIRM|nr:acetylglutamate kinase [Aminicella lysinilytica]TDP57711.1 N-acetylglutamate kinase [Aminicella lysinilytica]